MVSLALTVLAALGLSSPVLSQSVKASYPERAAAEQYRIANREWVLAGATKRELIERTRAAIASNSFKNPEAGAISFMLSKEGYLGDVAGGPWLPHVMIFLPHGAAVSWGASKEGSPIIGQYAGAMESTVLFIPVRSWSDGTPAPAPSKKHQM